MSESRKSVIQFIVEEQRVNPAATGDLFGLLNDIVSACKKISHLVGRIGLTGLGGYTDSENVQGETQRKLDVISNEVMINHLKWTGHLAAMASEENEEIIQIPERYPKGKYLVCFDPLDGSGNIDINFSVGTIFSILRCPEGTKTPTHKDFMQPGTEQVCAGFCIYGPSTMLIMTTGRGVNGFTLDRDVGEFFLTHPNMSLPKDTAEFAINVSNHRYWEPPVRRYVDECIKGVDGGREKNFNMRWNASMVAEVFRLLTRGGVFMYPMDSRLVKQGGRLRLMYEANPMSFLIEQAGGMSTTGYQRIMEVQPEDIHQRVPVILGSKHEIERIIKYHQEEN
jgi:fructose-1,6-bisphosphatase I